VGLKRFDRKFGQGFLGGVPDAPGVYLFHDDGGTLLYVGKAKRLRRRLAQYRNAKRLKSHRKMRMLVDSAATLRWEICESELDASLREVRLIQAHRPKRNVASAFSFLYPLIGIGTVRQTALPFSIHVRFVFTTLPQQFTGYRFFGAFRSREVTAEAFFSLMRLLRFVGHPLPSRDLAGERDRDYSYVFGFRRIRENTIALWESFFRGESTKALEGLTMTLLEHAGARARAAEVEGDLLNIRRFWIEEASVLAACIRATGYDEYPLPQTERDPLFVRYRSGLERSSATEGSRPGKGGHAA